MLAETETRAFSKFFCEASGSRNYKHRLQSQKASDDLMRLTVSALDGCLRISQ